MSMTNYELCHVSYRGYMEKEIGAAREVLRRYKKSCVDAVKELHRETDMPMDECSHMLRCLRCEVERDQLKAENAKLREYAAKAWSLFIKHGAVHACDLSEVDAVRDGLHELGVEVDA